MHIFEEVKLDICIYLETAVKLQLKNRCYCLVLRRF